MHGRPEKVTVDKSGSNKAALDHLNKDVPPEKKIIIRHLNNIVEQDHRFIKKRTKPMLGFKSFSSARETLSGTTNIRMIQKEQIIGQAKEQSAFQNFCNLFA